MKMSKGEKLVWAATFGSCYHSSQDAQKAALLACRAVDALNLLFVESLPGYPETYPANDLVRQVLGLEHEREQVIKYEEESSQTSC